MFAEISAEGWVAIITAIGLLAANLVGQIAGILVSLSNGRKTDETHKVVNSRLTDLIAAVKATSFAEGEQSERNKIKGTE